MQVRIREDSVEIEGYVNAIERKSKPLPSRIGKFMERICKGAFKKAIQRNDNIRLLLNHDWGKDLGGTKDGNLTLTEDNIGLKARAIITDPEVVKKARNGDLVGWSFGFEDVPNGVEQTVEDGLPTRAVKDLDLKEVSLLDRTKKPAYDGTLVTVRSEDDMLYQGEPFITEMEIREEMQEPKQHENVEEPKNIDYSKYEAIIAEIKED
jgi:HK97 family phage prohead protease